MTNNNTIVKKALNDPAFSLVLIKYFYCHFFQYSLAYAFLKLVNYSFFFWLPFYLNNALNWAESDADKLSTLYDIAGIVGKWRKYMFVMWLIIRLY